MGHSRKNTALGAVVIGDAHSPLWEWPSGNALLSYCPVVVVSCIAECLGDGKMCFFRPRFSPVLLGHLLVVWASSSLLSNNVERTTFSSFLVVDLLFLCAITLSFAISDRQTQKFLHVFPLESVLTFTGSLLLSLCITLSLHFKYHIE